MYVKVLIIRIINVLKKYTVKLFKQINNIYVIFQKVLLALDQPSWMQLIMHQHILCNVH